MVFTMLSCVNRNKTISILLLVLLPALLWPGEFSAKIQSVNVEKAGADYILNAHLDYVLSPTAKEAIQKGVPLSWILVVEVQRKRWFWNKTIYAAAIPFVIQYHALLNQYSVTNKNSKNVEIFSTLVSALNAMATVRHLKLMKSSVIRRNESYRVALKVQFDREFLPVPLRPESYFDSDWSLSSNWFIWHNKK